MRVSNRSSVSRYSSDGLIEKKRLADILDLGYRASQIERLGQNNLEDLEERYVSKLLRETGRMSGPMTNLLDVDAVTGAGEDQASLHGLGEALSLRRDLLLLFSREVDEVVVFGAD